MLIPAFILAVTSQQPELGPTIPAGTHSSFAESVLAIEERLEKGDFAGASSLLSRLPKKTIKISWDDSQVPAKDRAHFTEARDRVVKNWMQAVPSLNIAVGKPADISFAFAKTLPQEEGQPHPPGAVHFFSNDPKEVRLETVISLKRSASPLPGRKDEASLVVSEAPDIHNEVAFAIASYLGLGEAKLAGTYASRYDFGNVGATRLTSAETRLVAELFEIQQVLRKAVQGKKRLAAARARLALPETEIRLPNAKQGEAVSFKFQIDNAGNSPLMLKIQPDCGCLAARYDSELKAGGTTLVNATVNTFDFVGDLKKRFYIYSNDPEKAMAEFVVTIKVQPMYEIVIPGGPTRVMGDDPYTFDAFIALADGVEMNVKEFRLDGAVPAKVSHEMWTGVIPGETEPKKGIKFTFNVDSKVPNGRLPATLLVVTTNQMFPVLRLNFNVQKGIVALPDMVYFGQVPKAPRRGAFLVSRPNKGFKILKVESDNPHFTAEARSIREDTEYRVVVDYDGKSDFGTIEASLTVTTDDPKQPTIKVPIRIIVK